MANQLLRNRRIQVIDADEGEVYGHSRWDVLATRTTSSLISLCGATRCSELNLPGNVTLRRFFLISKFKKRLAVDEMKEKTL